MDSFDTTNVLFSKIKTLDPENASKIMGYLLIQDFAEKDLKRLAHGQDNLLHAVILKARAQLGLSSNALPSSPLNPISRPTAPNIHNPFSQSSPRIENNGFLEFSKNPSSPPSNSWSPNNKNTNFSPKSSPFLSYDNIRSGSPLVPATNGGGGGGADCSTGGDFIDEFQLNDYLSFLNDSSSKNEEVVDPRLQLSGFSVNNGDTHLHRRSFSASDVCLGSEDGGLSMGFRPCHYFARGFCKNGDSCKFVHGGFGGDSVDVNGGFVGSPSKVEGLYLQHEEMMRMKAAHQQRLAAQLIGGGVSPLAYNQKMNLFLQQQNDLQRPVPPELMIEEFYKYGRCRPDRNDILAMGLAEKVNSAARQIYLTFPADSSFTDEDVSNYFSMFGPVQDVRIPYQQKRMFGFVTFVHPETVKLILARGNPHFICDSRVLVKPYKEKGKVPEKRQQHLQQQLEMGNFSPCSSPSGIDCREPYEFQLGAKMFYNAPEVMFRRRLEEQADLQQAIELQRRRFMNLQLPNWKNDSTHHHHRSLSVGSPGSLPSHILINQNAVLSSDVINQKITEGSPIATIPSAAAEQQFQQEVTAICTKNNDSSNSKDMSWKAEGFDHHEHPEGCVNQSPPDILSTSPANHAEDHLSALTTPAEANQSTTVPGASSSEDNKALPAATPSGMPSH